MPLVVWRGTMFRVGDETMSIVPHHDQSSAAQNTAMMVSSIARPIGDGGVSTISSAAGRNASSLPRRPGVRLNGMTWRVGDVDVDGLVDFMEACLQTVQ